MTEFLLPRTDDGVLTQMIAVIGVLVVVLVAVRHDREYRTFVVGLVVLALGLFGLRAIH